jgi:hypothetical protein
MRLMIKMMPYIGIFDGTGVTVKYNICMNDSWDNHLGNQVGLNFGHMGLFLKRA